MTAQRLGRLVAAGDADAVRAAVTAAPACSAATVERDGQGGWTPLHLAVAEGHADVVAACWSRPAPTSARGPSTTGRRCTSRCSSAPTWCRCCCELGAAARRAERGLPRRRRRADRASWTTAPRLTDPATGVDLLSWAALGGAASTARLLLERGADADGGALHAAAAAAPGWSWCGCCSTPAPTSTAGTRDTGRTPLHAAVAAGPGGDAPEVVRGAALRRGGRRRHDQRRRQRAGHQPRWPPPVTGARDAGRATANDALAELLVSHGATD